VAKSNAPPLHRQLIGFRRYKRRLAERQQFVFTILKFAQNYSRDMRCRRCLIFGAGIFPFCAIFLMGLPQTMAETFIVDASQSHITISGKIDGLPIAAQGPGSLTAAYDGYINAAVSSSTIQFTGASMVTAITNGVWEPAAGGAAGSAPADYAGQVTVPLFGTGYGAGRNVALDMTSPVLTLTQTNFDSSQLTISVVASLNPVCDYRLATHGGSLLLSTNFDNAIATGSSFSTNGDLLRLVVQINATMSGPDNSAVTLTGKIEATNLLSVFAPPVITGMAVTNQSFVLTVSNATAQSQLLSSTNLTTWTPASTAINTNDGFVIFTTPMAGPRTFFRVQK
jgi:hypothetical protein